MDDKKWQEALDRYNAKWSGTQAGVTRDLYEKATAGKTAQYGCRLQDHVLTLLGGYESPRKIKQLCKKAQAWVTWMTDQDSPKAKRILTDIDYYINARYHLTSLITEKEATDALLRATWDLLGYLEKQYRQYDATFDWIVYRERSQK